jgi:predicted component of type VI protein secretion system
MPEAQVVRMRLSLNGRPLNSYKFSKDVIMVGRDPNADIFVDNPGVSREHLKFEMTPSGDYRLVDLGSANGTFLNEERVKAAYVRNNDVVRFGKFTLWIGLEPDRRKRQTEDERKLAPIADQATTILSPAELEKLMSTAREKEQAVLVGEEPTFAEAATPAASPAPAAPPRARSVGILLWVMIFLGAAIGAGTTWFLSH